MALFTQTDDLHNLIAKIENELEADLLLVEHEAKLVKNKIL
jgi:ABC-type branched-subunit amino acid transport system ATPase component